MKRIKVIAITLGLWLAAIPFILTGLYNIGVITLPEHIVKHVNLLSLIIGIILLLGWIVALLVIIKGYNKDHFGELEAKFEQVGLKFEGLYQKIQGALYSVHVKTVHNWIVPDDELDAEYESKVEVGKAIIVVTSTFRNDYPHDNSTGPEFVEHVSRNLRKGIKYRHITSTLDAERHFYNMIKYHSQNNKIQDGDIRVFVTPIPIINELVYYPLDRPAGFYIVYTDQSPGYGIAEFNVKMLKNEDLVRMQNFVKYILNDTTTKVWEYNDTGISKRTVSTDDKADFLRLTDITI